MKTHLQEKAIETLRKTQLLKDSLEYEINEYLEYCKINKIPSKILEKVLDEDATSIMLKK